MQDPSGDGDDQPAAKRSKTTTGDTTGVNCTNTSDAPHTGRATSSAVENPAADSTKLAGSDAHQALPGEPPARQSDAFSPPEAAPDLVAFAQQSTPGPQQTSRSGRGSAAVKDLVGLAITGTVDARFDCGFFVSLNVGDQVFSGVLYCPQAAAAAAAARRVSAAPLPRATPVGAGGAPSTAAQAAAPAVAAEVNSGGALGLAAAAPSKRQRSVKNPTRPKAGKTAFNYFAAEVWQRAKDTVGPNGGHTDVSRLVGEWWARVDEVSRARYAAMAVADKQRYERELRDYENGPEPEDDGGAAAALAGSGSGGAAGGGDAAGVAAAARAVAGVPAAAVQCKVEGTATAQPSDVRAVNLAAQLGIQLQQQQQQQQLWPLAVQAPGALTAVLQPAAAVQLPGLHTGMLQQLVAVVGAGQPAAAVAPAAAAAGHPAALAAAGSPTAAAMPAPAAAGEKEAEQRLAAPPPGSPVAPP